MGMNITAQRGRPGPVRRGAPEERAMGRFNDYAFFPVQSQQFVLRNSLNSA